MHSVEKRSKQSEQRFSKFRPPRLVRPARAPPTPAWAPPEESAVGPAGAFALEGFRQRVQDTISRVAPGLQTGGAQQHAQPEEELAAPEAALAEIPAEAAADAPAEQPVEGQAAEPTPAAELSWPGPLPGNAAAAEEEAHGAEAEGGSAPAASAPEEQDAPAYVHGNPPSDAPAYVHGNAPSDVPAYVHGNPPSDAPAYVHGNLPSDGSPPTQGWL